jgi:hypothetical protein
MGKIGKEERILIVSAEKKGNSIAKSGQIVLIGASYTKEWDIPEIAGMKVINMGVDGNQSFEMLARFREDVIVLTPRAVLIWGFINDIHRSKREDIAATTLSAKESIKEMVRLSKSSFRFWERKLRFAEPMVSWRVYRGPSVLFWERKATGIT